MILRGTRPIRGLHRGARKQHFLLKGERPVFLSPELAKASMKEWLRKHAGTTVVMVDDADGFWMELEITLPDTFTGGPATGWTDGTMSLGLSWSDNLVDWVSGGWIAAPGKTTATLSGGRKKWFVRYSTTPSYWKTIMVDLTITSNRYGKSITAISALQTSIGLSGFPYAMPADAARLQADLRSAGYTGTTVSSVSEPLSILIRNHLSGGTRVLQTTMSAGGSVTEVRDNGVLVSLAYPYSMPTQRAALQTALRAAGKSGAVVNLFDDTWTMTLPNRLTTGQTRDIDLTISPGDPFPGFDMFGNYTGEAPNAAIQGTSSNVRTPSGGPLSEAKRGFARLGFINIPTFP